MYLPKPPSWFSHCLFLFLIFQVSGPVAPKEEQKASPSFLHQAMGGGKDVNFLGRDSLSPGDSEAVTFRFEPD